MVSEYSQEFNQHQIRRCQACRSIELKRLLDLGYQPLCNQFTPIGKSVGPQTFYPLCLCQCQQCLLVQLDYVIPTELAFGDQYTYLTGSSNSLINYYQELATNLVDRLNLKSGDYVVDIGSNDGTFLKSFKSLGMNVIGVEGAEKTVLQARANDIPTIDQFFQKGIGKSIKTQLPADANPRLITAMNVLAHTDNINEFLPEVRELMGPESVFVNQSHWLISLIKKMEFDTIYHEHLRYYTLSSLIPLLTRHGLNVFDAETTDFYGGSILTYATKDTITESDRLKELMDFESETNIPDSLIEMKSDLLANKAEFLNLLIRLKASGKRIVGVGAPMKASTLLNFFGVTSELMEYIGEVNQLKIGTTVPGVQIPVIHEDAIFNDPPDVAVVLSWNMAEDIMRIYRSRGYSGEFILPVPSVQVIP